MFNNLKLPTKTLVAIILLLSSTVSIAQQCDWFFKQLNAWDNRRFAITESTIITDRLSKLSWKRCLVGQNWSSTTNRCVGNIQQLTYQQAKDYIKEHPKWRLPTKKELNFLIHFRCRPAINQAIFDMPKDAYVWSSTPDNQYANSMYIHSLDRGLSHPSLDTKKHPIIIVKK